VVADQERSIGRIPFLLDATNSTYAIPNPSKSPESRLLVIIIGVIIDDVEELELVVALRGSDDAEPVAELHLLEELLGTVVPELSAMAPEPGKQDRVLE
jgi:hypothetical protein